MKRLFSGFFLCVLLCLHATGPFAITAAENKASASDDIVLLNLLYTTSSDDESSTKQNDALLIGLYAALYANDYSTRGRKIRLISKPEEDDGSNIIKTVTDALDQDPNILAAIGPYGDERTMHIINDASVKEDYKIPKDFSFLAPFTGGMQVRTWTPQLVYTRAEPLAELYELINYAVNGINVRRFGYMYLTEVNFGEELYRYATLRFARYNRKEVATYITSFEEPFDEEAFETFADTNPQVIFAMGAPGKHLEQFLEKCFTHPKTNEAVILCNSANVDMVYEVYMRLTKEKNPSFKVFDGHIVSSFTNTLPSQKESIHIKEFNEDFEKYKQDKLTEEEANKILDNPVLSAMAVAGWISAKAVLAMLDIPIYLSSRKLFQSSLFLQRRYIIGEDLILGDYGGECNDALVLQGAACECNQGGRLALVNYFYEDGTAESAVQNAYTYPLSICSASKAVAVLPINLLIFQPIPSHANAETAAVYEANQAFVVKAFQRAKTEAMGSAYNLNVYTLNSTTNTIQQDLDHHLRDRIYDVFASSDAYNVNTEGVLVINPTAHGAHLSSRNPDLIYLMPTLEQQIYVMFSYLVNVIVRNTTFVSNETGVNIVLRGLGEEANKIKAQVEMTERVLKTHDPNYKIIEGDAPLKRYINKDEINIVFGFTVGDAEVMFKALEESPKTVIMLNYNDFSVHYNEIIAAASETDYSIQKRFLTVTNLPNWNDNSEAAYLKYEILESFHTVFPNPVERTPHNLEVFVTLMFLADLAQVTFPINSTNLRKSLYTNGMVVVDELIFGRFVDCDTRNDTTIGEHCDRVNYGANDIFVRSVASVLDPHVPAVFGPFTPSMDFSVPQEGTTGLSTKQIIGIIVGAVAVAGVLVAVLVVIFCCCVDSRDNHYAPKSLEEPVTLIFTDIESSTALWAAAPTLMPDAVATHHKLIRQLIQKYKCYEVKTIGDSFMIACKSAFSAVQLAQELQKKFLKHDWGTEEIDDCYHSFENRKACEIPDYEPPSANLSPEVYAALWNGIRVRVGIHTGLSDIRCDDVTGGYDYYGETSNMAARTEAIANGGQVVMTESTWWALSDDERSGLLCTNLNSQALRGVPFNVEMYQLDCVEGRKYAALRTEIEAILPDDGFDDTATNSDATGALLSTAGTLTGPSAAIATILSSCFSPYPAAERIRQIQPLLQKWSIPVPPRNRRIPEEDYCRGLLNRLAIKMASVASIHRSFGNAPLPVSPSGSRNVHSRGSEQFAKPNALLDRLMKEPNNTTGPLLLSPRAGGSRNGRPPTGRKSLGEDGDYPTIFME